NAIVSTGQVMAAPPPLPEERLPIGEDARRLPNAEDSPRLLVLVVGETVRAANWGLSGYDRQTTPRLADRDVVNFREVASCGTSTAVSLPCMFSPQGRDDYDERFTRSHESLLDVVQRAGYRVVWIDNQSGCKGVCDGVEQASPAPEAYPELCGEEGCLDGVLVEELARRLGEIREDTVVVLHMLGNHGPSYFQRYPEDFRAFTPTCDTADLAQCDQEAIVNSYDNAILYTDNVLDRIIGVLERNQSLATAMLYVSDHGESLGEKGIYLHGLPYAIAPLEQTRVPMVWWASDDFLGSQRLTNDCLTAQRGASLSHAHLFHSLLGLLGIESEIKRDGVDLSAACHSTNQALSMRRSIETS
ncbi:MAG TPA: sulfatase-like hydrolase/transferase, partial [Halomonas sp.]|nr:sulfatase-like hydrolase/transferase [Halomonas sp.]